MITLSLAAAQVMDVRYCVKVIGDTMQSSSTYGVR